MCPWEEVLREIRSRGYRPLGVCAPYAALFHRLRRFKVKVVERCSTPRKLLKKFDQNFHAASRLYPHIYSI